MASSTTTSWALVDDDADAVQIINSVLNSMLIGLLWRRRRRRGMKVISTELRISRRSRDVEDGNDEEDGDDDEDGNSSSGIQVSREELPSDV